MGEFLPVQNPDIAQILQAVDSRVSRTVHVSHPESTRADEVHLAHDQIVIVHRLDRSALTFHPEELTQLSEDVERLRSENSVLKEQLATLQQEVQCLKEAYVHSTTSRAPIIQRGETSTEAVSEEIVKVCNAIPKNIGNFFAQMHD